MGLHILNVKSGIAVRHSVRRLADLAHGTNCLSNLNHNISVRIAGK